VSNFVKLSLDQLRLLNVFHLSINSFHSSLISKVIDLKHLSFIMSTFTDINFPIISAFAASLNVWLSVFSFFSKYFKTSLILS
jgi:hypothetical protein